MFHRILYTGYFISPSGISDLCGTVTGMVTPKGSMSTDGESFQVSALPYRLQPVSSHAKTFAQNAPDS